MDNIHILEDTSYTLSEVIDLVKQTLDGVSKDVRKNKLRYSSTDVYWLLYDMIRYINQNVPGEYVLHQTKKGVYQVRYTTKDSARQKSSRKLEAEVNRTASYLEELTGRRPAWDKKKEGQNE